MFIHYFDFNIREKTLLEVLQSPLFMAYHDGQPFNENYLRPCPMLENPELLREMIAKTGGFPFYKHPKTFYCPKGSFTNPQGIYLVEKRTLQNAKSFFLGLRYKKDTLLFEKKNIFFGHATLLFKYSISSITQINIKCKEAGTEKC